MFEFCVITVLNPVVPFDQLYDAPLSGLETVKVTVCPLQKVIGEFADITGIGLGLTVTVIGGVSTLQSCEFVTIQVKFPLVEISTFCVVEPLDHK